MVRSTSANSLKRAGTNSDRAEESVVDKKDAKDLKETHLVHSTSTNFLHGDSLDKDEENMGDATFENIPTPECETVVEVVNPGLLKIPTVVVEDEEDKAMLWSKVDALYCFRYLLLFNAALLSYAHGDERKA